jgi:hypothetical protein
VDPSWSGAAARDFNTDLTEVATAAKFTVSHVECRTSQCRVGLKWPSYDQATQTWKQALHKTYKQNCGVEAFVPTPDDPTQPYEAMYYFDCLDQRAN